MKSRTLLLQIMGIVQLLNICTAHSFAQEKHLGAPFTLTETTPISDLTAHPEKYFNRDVRIEGVIASACTNEGCFIEVAASDGSGDGIVVNFPELVHKFPTDCAGRGVIVEGMFYQKIYPSARVLHWQSHSFRKGKRVPEFSIIRRVTAKAVSIGKRVGVPKPDDIEEAQIDRINLNVMEFEAEGFGTGKKVLTPGEVTKQHSTGKYREILFCVEGTLTIVKGEKSRVMLSSGEMTYIPPETKHEIRNETDKPATYLFVYVRKLETENSAHSH